MLKLTVSYQDERPKKELRCTYFRFEDGFFEALQPNGDLYMENVKEILSIEAGPVDED